MMPMLRGTRRMMKDWKYVESRPGVSLQYSVRVVKSHRKGALVRVKLVLEDGLAP